MSKIFIDTNILAYTVDQYDKKRQKRCRERLMELEERDQGVISTQVIQEFFVVATKKLGIPPLKAKEILHFLENYETVLITPQIIKDAIDHQILQQISFWDALIVAGAEAAGCEKIWTEDLSPGQNIAGILIENPLVEG